MVKKIEINSLKEWKIFLKSNSVPSTVIVQSKTDFTGKVIDVMESICNCTKKILDLKVLDSEIVYGNLGTQSLFSPKTMYVVKNISLLSKNDREKLIDAMNKPVNNRIIVISLEETESSLQKKLKDYVYVKEPVTVDEMIKVLVEEYELNLDKTTLNIIKEWAGSSGFLLRSVFEKLSVVPEGKKLSESEIIDMIGEGGQKELYELTNSIVDRNLEKALSILHNLKNWGIDIYVLISMIRSMWIRLLIIYLCDENGCSIDKIGSIIGRKSWYVKKTLYKISGNFGRIEHGLEIIYETEYLLRSSVNKDLLVENLVYELCK